MREKMKMPENIRGLNFKAVLVGLLVDTIGTLVIASVLVATLAAKGLPQAEIMVRLHSLNGLLLMLILGLGFTVLGGYVTGRTAKQAELLNGAAVAAAGIILGLFLRDPGLPLWYEVISFAATIPAGVGGGYLAKEGKAKRNLTRTS
jgi:hypothetical protein